MKNRSDIAGDQIWVGNGILTKLAQQSLKQQMSLAYQLTPISLLNWRCWPTDLCHAVRACCWLRICKGSSVRGWGGGGVQRYSFLMTPRKVVPCLKSPSKEGGVVTDCKAPTWPWNMLSGCTNSPSTPSSVVMTTRRLLHSKALPASLSATHRHSGGLQGGGGIVTVPSRKLLTPVREKKEE